MENGALDLRDIRRTSLGSDTPSSRATEQEDDKLAVLKRQRQELTRLRTENASLYHEVETHKAEIARLNKQCRATTQRASHAETELEASVRDVTLLRQELEDQAQQHAAVGQQWKQSEQELLGLLQQHSETNGHLNRTVHDLEQQLERSQQECQAATAEANELRTAFGLSEQRISELIEQLSDAEAGRRAAVKAFDSKRSEFRENELELSDKVEQLQAQLEQATENTQSMAAQVERLSADNQSLVSNMKQVLQATAAQAQQRQLAEQGLSAAEISLSQAEERNNKLQQELRQSQTAATGYRAKLQELEQEQLETKSKYITLEEKLASAKLGETEAWRTATELLKKCVSAVVTVEQERRTKFNRHSFATLAEEFQHQLERAWSDMQRKVSNMKQLIDDQDSKLTQQANQISQLDTSLQTAMSSSRRMESEFRTVRGRIEAELQSASTEIDRLKKECDKERSEHTTTREELKAAKGEVEAGITGLLAAVPELRVFADHENSLPELGSAVGDIVSSLQSRLKAEQDVRAEKEAAHSQQTTQVRQLRQDNERLRTRVEDLTRSYHELAGTKLSLETSVERLKSDREKSNSQSASSIRDLSSKLGILRALSSKLLAVCVLSAHRLQLLQSCHRACHRPMIEYARVISRVVPAKAPHRRFQAAVHATLACIRLRRLSKAGASKLKETLDHAIFSDDDGIEAIDMLAASLVPELLSASEPDLFCSMRSILSALGSEIRVDGPSKSRLPPMMASVVLENIDELTQSQVDDRKALLTRERQLDEMQSLQQAFHEENQSLRNQLEEEQRKSERLSHVSQQLARRLESSVDSSELEQVQRQLESQQELMTQLQSLSVTKADQETQLQQQDRIVSALSERLEQLALECQQLLQRQEEEHLEQLAAFDEELREKEQLLETALQDKNRLEQEIRDFARFVSADEKHISRWPREEASEDQGPVEDIEKSFSASLRAALQHSTHTA